MDIDVPGGMYETDYSENQNSPGDFEKYAANRPSVRSAELHVQYLKYDCAGGAQSAWRGYHGGMDCLW